MGVTRDVNKSDQLLLEAADFGVPQAQLKLGHFYLNGTFGHAFKQDYRAALLWFQRAAGHGLAEAEYEVGQRYENNEGVDGQDMGMAAAAYLRAAALGFVM